MVQRPQHTLFHHLAHNYKEIRDELGLSDAQVARLAKPYAGSARGQVINDNLLSRLARGHLEAKPDHKEPVDLRVSQLIALAIALKTSPVDLLRPRAGDVVLGQGDPPPADKVRTKARFTRWLREGPAADSPLRTDQDNLADVYWSVNDAYTSALSGDEGAVLIEREAIIKWLDRQVQTAKATDKSRQRARERDR